MTEIDWSRAKAIFGEALELQGKERTSYLEAACAGNAHLRSRVEAFLAAAAKDDGFLAGATVEPSVASPSTAPITEAPGARIGPYRLLQLIGEGGFGSVFMAEQEHPVRRRVALKIIKLGMDTRAVVARFEQERQALAVLDHPNIAKVLDAGATDAGRPYFVMELVKGEPITTYADANHLTIPDRLELFTQVCSAVQHAHTKGIIHRDLKPSNILVSQVDSRPSARIIDFGIAKATDQRLTEKTLFTEFHQIVGTPEYMSPEQAGGSLDIDTRTDVYSLGVILYELLTGATPFDPRRLRSAAFDELRRIIREDDPPRPSTRLSQSTDTLSTVAARRRIEPRRLNVLLRGELDWIVMKTLDKDRSRRYDSASALATDLNRYLSGDTVTAAPPTTSYRIRKFVRRNRGAVVTGAIIALALIAGLIIASIGIVKANAARVEEARQRELAREQAEIAQSINAFLNGMLATANVVDQGESDIRVSELLDRAGTDLASGVGPQDPHVRSALLDTIGRAYDSLGFYDKAVQHLREALRVRKLILSGDHELIAESLSSLFTALYHREDLVESVAVATECLDMRKRLYGDSHPLVAAALANLAVGLEGQREYDRAEPLFTQAMEILNKEPEAHREKIADALTSYGLLLLHRGSYSRAEPTLREALRAHRALPGRRDAAIATVLNNLSWTCSQQEKYAEAEQLIVECLDIRRRLLGDKHPLVAMTINNYGGILHAKKDLTGAEAKFREALEIRRVSLGPKNPNTISSLNNVASICQDLDKLDEAKELYELSLALRREVLPPDDPTIADSLGNLATLHVRRGELDAAVPLFREALDLRMRISPDHPDTALALSNLAAIYFRKKDYASAKPLIEQTLAVQQKIFDADSPEIVRTLGNLSLLSFTLGDYAQAESFARRALDIRKKQLPADDPRILNGEYTLALALTELAWQTPAAPEASRHLAEADALLRHVMDVRTATLPAHDLHIAQARLALGSAIITSCKLEPKSPDLAARFAAAEAMMLPSLEAFTTAKTPDAERIAEHTARVVRLYETWNELLPDAGKAAELDKWRAR